MARKAKDKARKSAETMPAVGGDPGEVTQTNMQAVDVLSCALRSVNIGSEQKTVDKGKSGNKRSVSRQSVEKGAVRVRRDKVQECCIKTSKSNSLQSKKGNLGDTQKGQEKQHKKQPQSGSNREKIHPKRNNIEFWKDIISRSLSDVIKKPVNLNSQDLDRKRPLKFDRLLVADFTCSSCNKHWDSTQVTVEVEYEAKFVNFQGHIRIKEYGQRCKKCSRNSKFEVPVFDIESSERMGMKLREKILVKYYGMKAPQITETEGHNRSERKKAHDMANCEACYKGTCRAEERSSGKPFSKSQNGEVGTVRFSSKPFTWSLSVGGKTRRIM
eukprot:GFUD01131327.1.p1 GENE.GFUD01131327.1~~GFUD01131327.1.p1  ORF type:complete len:328 (-),score=76.30 GFUD01131327.1:101-1084(-)